MSDSADKPNEFDRSQLAAMRQETQRLWEQKAAFWDERMGEGNDFQRLLVGPATERLLRIQPGERVLDVACGNGVMARRLAQLGAEVVATDFSPTFLERAAARSGPLSERIEYRLADATDEAQLLALGEGSFDAAACNMALMDMPTIAPLARALVCLLKPGGRCVFATQHPCFNSNSPRFVLEEEDRQGDVVEVYALKIVGYLDVAPTKGAGIIGEPNPHYYFHRPLHELLNIFFDAGFVLDRIEEPAFGPDVVPSARLGWGSFKQFPPVLAARLLPR